MGSHELAAPVNSRRALIHGGITLLRLVAQAAAQAEAKAHAATLAAEERARNATQARAGGHDQGAFPGAQPVLNRTVAGNATVTGSGQAALQQVRCPDPGLHPSRCWTAPLRAARPSKAAAGPPFASCGAGPRGVPQLSLQVNGRAPYLAQRRSSHL